MSALDSRILSLIRTKPQEFEELLTAIWGISPADLKDALERLQAQGIISQRGEVFEVTDRRNISTSQKGRDLPTKHKLAATDRRVKDFLSRLPLPHPHDFDWRFSVPGIRAFVEHISRYHTSENSICVISAPTVYAYLRFLDHYSSISLVERSIDTVDVIQSFFGDSAGVRRCDLQYPWPAGFIGEFDCIIMDPPWYQDYYELFLLRATEILSVGGLIHTALFPPFAKSHALSERSSIISFAQNRGLYLIELECGILEYESPPFEKQSFAVDGFEPAANWRRGDIASFFLGHKYGREHIFQVESGRWTEFRIEESKLKLRMDESGGYEAPSIETVEDGSPFLSNVSRKYSLRERIGLWTSCQQAYKIRGADVIATLIECILDSKNEEDSFHEVASCFGVTLDTVRSDCKESYNTLKEIIQRERETQNESR